MNHIKTEQDILHIIHQDAWMMDMLQTVQTLHLPDWWIGAGFVRSKVWDQLHGYKQRTPLPDIDVIYFDNNDLSEITEEIVKQKLITLRPESNWQVKNQARMHTIHADAPYKNASAGLARWIETATCIGVTLERNNHLKLTAPYGISDLINLVLRPSAQDTYTREKFSQRLQTKQWQKRWPKLQVFYS